MTEAEWLACADPRDLLRFLKGAGHGRRLRLFACACCRRVWRHLTEPASRRAVEEAERFADGLAGPDRLADAQAAAYPDPAAGDAGRHERCRFAQRAAILAAGHDAEVAALLAAMQAADAASGWGGPADAEWAAQCGLLRDIIGDPFRPVAADTAWLAWQAGTVTSLAHAAYEERLLPEGRLDPARLAILADALEDAGCTDAETLGHLRGSGPHVRGCWAVDLLLGKE